MQLLGPNLSAILRTNPNVVTRSVNIKIPWASLMSDLKIFKLGCRNGQLKSSYRDTMTLLPMGRLQPRSYSLAAFIPFSNP